MELFERDPASLHRVYETRLLTQWTEARTKVATMEAARAITSSRKRSEDIALADKYGMPEARTI